LFFLKTSLTHEKDHTTGAIQHVLVKTKENARQHIMTLFSKGDYFGFFLFYMYDIQHCFICRPSDSTVSEDAGIEPKTVATTALALRCSNHSAARYHPYPMILNSPFMSEFPSLLFLLVIAI
jgi:hypothetical protein